MKIALIIPYNPLEEVGGLEIGALRLAKSFIDLGHEALIISKGINGQIGRIKIIGFKSMSRICSWLISETTYDVFHWLEIFPGEGELEQQIAVSETLKLSGKIVSLMVATSGNLRNRGKKLLHLPVAQASFNFYIISNPDQQNEFQECGLSVNIHEIGFGVELEKFCPVDEARKARLRSLLDLPINKTLCLFMGRFVERKRPDFLLNSWNRLTDIHQKAELIIVGSGMEQHDSIESQVKELIAQTKAVRFFDITSEPERYYQACDILLLPSNREGQPNVLMEMLACANPVIGSDIAGIRELVTNGVNGYTFAVEDESAFADCIKKLVADPKLRSFLGENGRREIARIKSASTVAQQYIDLFQEEKKKGEEGI